MTRKFPCAAQVILEIAIDPPGTRYRKSISGAEIGFNAKSYRAVPYIRSRPQIVHAFAHPA